MPDPFIRFDTGIAANVLLFLPVRPSLCTCGAVSRRWAFVTSEEPSWRAHCEVDYGLTAKTAPPLLAISTDSGGDTEQNAMLVTWKAVWLHWDTVSRRLGLSTPVDAHLYTRVVQLWRNLHGWLATEIPAVRATLADGAASDKFSAAEKALGVTLPSSMRMVWGLHDGQNLAVDDRAEEGIAADGQFFNQIFHGLFGGYSFYHNMVCTRMFSLDRMVRWTLKLRRKSSAFAANYHTYIPICANLHTNKMIVLDTATDMVYHNVPNDTLPFRASAPAGKHGLVRWMEEYSHRLTAGVYRAAALFPDEEASRGINLFPQAGPDWTRAVTRGIQVTASAVYTPESPDSCFAYSIQLLIVDAAALQFPSAQLLTRHWRIKDAAGHVRDVEGHGVIGKFPVLRPGGYRDDEQGTQGPECEGTFVYQSCSGPMAGVPPGKGYFGGSLQMIPGTIEEPLGDPFDIVVEEFPIYVPDFVY
eukprot:NODE_126_length_1856_cov_354.967903_g86_i0.p1 GENE.NODE_126_length_1856_cov_354.967903_g86_i0~~NODE_126_length_1856_cov_354.967903_g86_i0.p1  ORF type:complete len:489 (-),score=125.71 NODE_126_length_1856_cov_354.967903_g86_i0:389-1804(-)